MQGTTQSSHLTASATIIDAPLTFVETLYVMYVSMVDTCFLGSSTVTKRSRVSPSRSSSSCSRFNREEEEAGLDVSTGVPLGKLRSWEEGILTHYPEEVESLKKAIKKMTDLAGKQQPVQQEEKKNPQMICLLPAICNLT